MTSEHFMTTRYESCWLDNRPVPHTCVHQRPHLKNFWYLTLNSSRLGLFCSFCSRPLAFMIDSWASSNNFSPSSFFSRSLQALSFGRPSNTFVPVPTGCRTQHNYVHIKKEIQVNQIILLFLFEGGVFFIILYMDARIRENQWNMVRINQQQTGEGCQLCLKYFQQ